MSFLSIGDLAQSFQTRRQAAQLKAQMARLDKELTSGRVADPARSLAGDYTALAGIERGLTRLDAFSTATREAALHTAGMQARLDALLDDGTRMAEQLNTVSGGSRAGLSGAIAASARDSFNAAVSALNAQVGGRTLFAGTAGDMPALAPAGDILAQLVADTAGIADPAVLEAAMADWFETPGAGFDQHAYLGLGTGLPALQIGPDDEIAVPGGAASPEIRAHLAGLALAALVDTGAPAGNDDARRAETLRRAGNRIAEARPGLVGLAARIGAVEARIDRAATRNTAEIAGLEFARQDLIAADPYEAAIRLEETRARLETFFAVTARLSRLSLTEFLR
ncbi:flagellin [Alkalilacustris brevis]|uniref:flagellin n=1 Tax=Alkalilacustris brevis TaxID=2026338 RepID=UPI000E0D50FA|nr:flagellin [Alkalilacustris brevis]